MVVEAALRTEASTKFDPHVPSMILAALGYVLLIKAEELEA